MAVSVFTSSRLESPRRARTPLDRCGQRRGSYALWLLTERQAEALARPRPKRTAMTCVHVKKM
jgi:hypothetical protein